MTVTVRPEARGDEAGIRAVQLAAFPTTAEADLVDALRADGDSVISLVACRGDQIVGHVLLSRMRVAGDSRNYRALGLGPVAVQPTFQRQGIAAALIDAALAEAERAGEELVFVLGEPAYYGRFGFTAAAAQPFASPYAGPYFMAKALAGDLPGNGTAAYPPAFGRLEMSRACHVTVTGRVQGVFFRSWTREQADELGVTGWVRNCPDGRVDAHIEGDQAAVAQLIERLHSGPPAAHVDSVRVWEVEMFDFDGFEIRH